MHWINKFAFAFRGLARAVANQSSFWVHIPVAIAVVTVASFLELELWRWCVVLLTIACVISAELFNTAIETLVQVLHPEHDERVGHALDTAAAAVLVLAMSAIVVGVFTIVMPLMEWLGFITVPAT